MALGPGYSGIWRFGSGACSSQINKMKLFGPSAECGPGKEMINLFAFQR